MDNEKKYTIMLVDDNQFNLLFVKNQLESAGYKVTTSLGGLKLFEMLNYKLPDLILLDITMPDMDGITVCKKLKENEIYKSIPVIFLTANEKVEAIIEGFQSGGVDYIKKPFIKEELLMRIKTHINLKETQSELNETIKILSNKNDEISRQNTVIKKINDELKTLSSELKKSAYTDALTGLFNRRFMLPRLKEELMKYERMKLPFSVVMSDIDYFKKVNDTYGHNIGDNVLVELSIILKKESKSTDIVCRWGGEEFLTLLPETDKHSAIEYANRVLNRLRGKSFKAGDRRFNVTATIGISICNEKISTEELIKRADDAMYEGKNNGRNRVVLFQ